MTATACEGCGTVTRELYATDFGVVCGRCAYHQEGRSEYGHGLSAGTYGFMSEDE
jgi:hypothetical protein